MNDNFFKWVKDNEQKFHDLELEIEICVADEEAKEEMTDPAQRIYLETKNYMGSICVWRSGQMDVEIIEVRTEKQVIYDYIERLPSNVDFHKILKPYFSIFNGSKVENE